MSYGNLVCGNDMHVSDSGLTNLLETYIIIREIIGELSNNDQTGGRMR
jgi:hypothetical protein